MSWAWVALVAAIVALVAGEGLRAARRAAEQRRRAAERAAVVELARRRARLRVVPRARRHDERWGFGEWVE